MRTFTLILLLALTACSQGGFANSPEIAEPGEVVIEPTPTPAPVVEPFPLPTPASTPSPVECPKKLPKHHVVIKSENGDRLVFDKDSGELCIRHPKK